MSDRQAFFDDYEPDEPVMVGIVPGGGPPESLTVKLPGRASTYGPVTLVEYRLSSYTTAYAYYKRVNP